MGEGCEGVWCGGRRREAVGGSSARRRLCGGSSSPVHVAQNDPCARERAKGGKVRGGRLQRRRRWPQGLRRAYRRLGDGRRDGSASVGGTGTGAGDAPCATIKKRPTRGRGACKKQGGEGQEWCNAREERARARGARTQEWGYDAGRVGAGGCSRRGGRQRQRGELHDGGALREVIPPPCRQGESNPKPCRPSGRQGGPANGFFRSAR